MLQLILVRHAKSSWSYHDLDDHSRPLNKRGRKSAAAIGNWLKQESYMPGVILSSTSQRTRETCELMDLGAPVLFDERLYLAEPDTMLACLKEAQRSVVLMLGHNPGIAAFAEGLVKEPPAHDRFYDYPTCATLVADFDIPSWSELRPKSGNVRNFVIPRELLT